MTDREPGTCGGRREPIEWRPGVRTRLHVGAATGATQLCVIEQWSEPGCGAPTHTHFEVEETITLVDGSADFWLDGARRRVETGETMLLPAWSRHGFVNAGAGVLRTLAAFSAASPRVEYEREPGVVYVIAGTGGLERDGH
jgi:quercetin dioxygenase-like cupin family protein